jgi:hypothetical protein
MTLPDDATETGKRRALLAADTDDATMFILPEEFSTGRFAECAGDRKSVV